MTAGAGAVFNQSGFVTVANVLASESSPTTTVTMTPTMASNLSGSLPLQFTLNGVNLSGTSTPTIGLSDPHPFDGSAPAITTTHFGSLSEFANLSAGDVLSGLQNLGATFGQLSQSADLSTPVPFASGVTFGKVFDFGGAFRQSIVKGLTSLPTPSAAPLLNPTGGGTSGGLLAPGTYYVEANYATSYGESAPGPNSMTFNVAAGQIPQVTVPAIPSGDTVNLYLSSASGTSGSATLYRSGITSTTVSLDQAASGSGATVTTSATSTALFGSAQELATLLGNVLATSSGSPYPVNVRFLPISAGSTRTREEPRSTPRFSPVRAGSQARSSTAAS